MTAKLAEEIRKALSQIVIGEYADGTPYYFGDETGQEMEEAIKLLMPLFPTYHEAKMKEEKAKKFYDKNTCVVCHQNYVDSANGFDTCGDCLSRI